MDSTIRVLIVDHERHVRRAWAEGVATWSGMVVVGNASTVEAGCRLAGDQQPDVIVVGASLPGAPGVAVVRTFRDRFPAASVIVMTRRECDEELFAAVCAGASAYVGQELETRTIGELIRRSAEGEFAINERLLKRPLVAARLLRQFDALPLSGDPLSPVTERELTILHKAGAGQTTAEIGLDLGMRARSVDEYITASLLKFGVGDCTRPIIAGLGRSRLGAGERIVPPDRRLADPLSWLSPQADEALLLAQAEAARLGNVYVGTGHVLVGLLGAQSSVAHAILTEHGIGLERVRSAIALTVGRMSITGRETRPRWSPRARMVPREGLVWALRFGHGKTGTGHLLLALVAERGGTAAGILESLGCRLESVQARAVVALIGGAVDEPDETERDASAMMS